MRGKDLLRRGALPLEERYYGNARIFRDDQLAAVLRGHDPELSHVDVTAPLYADSGSWDPVARMQHVDLFTWLRGDILVKADKMTMANSLELRVPFLDTEVFEVASHLPTDQKIAHGTTKYALRQAIDGIVPPHVLNRRKLGFPVPIRHWLAHDMLEWAREIVRDSQTDAILDKAAVLRLHRRPPRRPRRPLAADLDAAGVHALARHLRRGAHPPRDPGAELPGLCVNVPRRNGAVPPMAAVT